jgi:DnaJ-class molecular chaperone
VAIEFIDCYTVLGVSSSAPTTETASAYRRASLLHHPDKAPPEARAAANATFLPYRDAKEILIDPTRRRHYDSIRLRQSQYYEQPIEAFEGPIISRGHRQGMTKERRAKEKKIKKMGIVPDPWGGRDCWKDLGGVVAW